MGLFPGLVQGGWWAVRPTTGGRSARGKQEQPRVSCREGAPWAEGPQRRVSRAGVRPGAQEREALAHRPHVLSSGLASPTALEAFVLPPSLPPLRASAQGRPVPVADWGGSPHSAPGDAPHCRGPVEREDPGAGLVASGSDYQPLFGFQLRPWTPALSFLSFLVLASVRWG